MSPSEGSSSNNYIYRRGMSLRNGHIGASLNMPYYRLCYLRGPIAALFKSGFQWLHKSQDPTGREGSFYPACHPRFMVKVILIYQNTATFYIIPHMMFCFDEAYLFIIFTFKFIS